MVGTQGWVKCLKLSDSVFIDTPIPISQPYAYGALWHGDGIGSRWAGQITSQETVVGDTGGGRFSASQGSTRQEYCACLASCGNRDRDAKIKLRSRMQCVRIPGCRSIPELSILHAPTLHPPTYQKDIPMLYRFCRADTRAQLRRVCSVGIGSRISTHWYVLPEDIGLNY